MFIVDTASSISMIQPRVYLNDVSPTNISPFGVTGNQLEIRGMQEVKFQLKRREFCHQFCVCLLPTEADGILGMGFFAHKNAELDLGKLQLRLKRALVSSTVMRIRECAKLGARHAAWHSQFSPRRRTSSVAKDAFRRIRDI